MERNYGQVGKVITGIFSFLVCAGIVGAQVGAMGYVFEILMGIPRGWGIVIGCGIVIAYATMGGMRAVVLTDIVQFAMLAIGITLTLVIGIQAAGGWSVMMSAVPESHWQIPALDMTLLGFISLFLIFVLGETLVPPYVQRLFVARNAEQVRRGTLWAGIFSIPFFAIAGGIGLVALAMTPTLDANLALPHVVNTVLPPVLKGLVIASMIAVVMSSADSFLNAASVAITNDVVRPVLGKSLSDRALLRTAQGATLAVGVLAVVFAFSIRSVLDILIYAYNFWAPVILVPLVAVLLGKRAGLSALLAGAGAGIAANLGWDRLLGRPGDIDGLIIGVVANLVAFIIAAKVTGDRPMTAPAKLSGERL